MIDLPPDPDDTASPASLSVPADPGDYVVQSGARAGQAVSQFPTDLLRIISRGGAKDPAGDSAAFARAVESELERRAAAAKAKAEAEGQQTIQAAPAASRAAPRGVRGDMPPPCGHPVSMLEPVLGGVFQSRCLGCARLDDLQDSLEDIVKGKLGKVMDCIRE